MVAGQSKTRQRQAKVHKDAIKHAMPQDKQRRPRNRSVFSHSFIYSAVSVGVNIMGRRQEERQRSHTPDDRMIEKNTEGHIFTAEKVARSKRTAVGREMDGEKYRQRCAEKTNSMCSPYRQRRFQRYRVWIGDTAHTSVQWRSRCQCAVYLFSHPQGRWQDQGSWRVKGQSPRVADTHTHTPKHFISITNQTGSRTFMRSGTEFGSRGCRSEHLWISFYKVELMDSPPRRSGPDTVQPLHNPSTPTDVFTSLTGLFPVCIKIYWVNVGSLEEISHRECNSKYVISNSNLLQRVFSFGCSGEGCICCEINIISLSLRLTWWTF